MKSGSLSSNPDLRVPVAGLLTWLLPGAGHLFIGDRGRGIVFMATIGVTFWTGVAIGGVKNTVNFEQRKLWFIGQICTGSHALAAIVWSRQLPDGDALLTAYGRAEEISVVYTAICGMLNILILFDVLVRAERGAVAVAPRAPPGRGRPTG
jgi:hypothetical protein